MQNKQNKLVFQKQNRSGSSNGRASLEIRSDCIPTSPRISVMRIKQFHEATYGVPCNAEIIQVTPSQQAFGSALSISAKRTFCDSCKIKTQNVQIRKCGNVGIFWSCVLLPCCLCLLPGIIDSCRDLEVRCVLCWQAKELKTAKLCNCV